MQIVEKYKDLFNKYGVNTPLRLSHFLAQADHESGLKSKRENLMYTSLERLVQIFRGDFDKNKDRAFSKQELEFAKQYIGKPEKIANFVYANQNGNGNEASGDGWKFRGGGMFQTTGRENYQRLTKATGVDFMADPNIILQEKYGILSALHYWSTINGNKYADSDDILGLTKRINGGTIGLEDRRQKLKKYKKYYGIA